MRVQCANNTNVTLAPHNCERKIRHKQGWPNKHTSTAHSVSKIKDRRNNNTLSNHICSRFTPPVGFSFLKHQHCPNIDAGLKLFRIVSSYINWKKNNIKTLFKGINIQLNIYFCVKLTIILINFFSSRKTKTNQYWG